MKPNFHSVLVILKLNFHHYEPILCSSQFLTSCVVRAAFSATQRYFGVTERCCFFYKN